MMTLWFWILQLCVKTTRPIDSAIWLFREPAQLSRHTFDTLLSCSSTERTVLCSALASSSTCHGKACIFRPWIVCLSWFEVLDCDDPLFRWQLMDCNPKRDSGIFLETRQMNQQRYFGGKKYLFSMKNKTKMTNIINFWFRYFVKSCILI